MKICPACRAENADHLSRCAACAASLARVAGGTTRIGSPATGGTGHIGGPAAPTATATAGSLPFGLVLAGAGGIIAAVAWVLIAGASEMQLSILALLVGAGIGGGMWCGARGERGHGSGLLCGAAALVVILASKYAIAEGMIARFDREILAEAATPEAMIRREAEELERRHPDDYGEDEIGENGFPRKLWADATKAWNDLGGSQQKAKQQAVKAERRQEMAESHGLELSIMGGLMSLSGIGATLAAIGLAYSIGSGTFAKR